MDRNEAKAIIENILFVADEPLSVESLVTLFDGGFTADEMTEILSELRDDYESGALRLAEVAEGWRVQTNPEYARWITSFYKMEKGHRLTRASLETLAIIAYRQPITRAEVDEIRGVDSGGVLRGLIDKNLVRTMGRRKVPGRPMMYGTTSRFLVFFGLARLADMPTLDEFQAEFGEDVPESVRQEAMDFSSNGENEDSGSGEGTEREENDDSNETAEEDEIYNEQEDHS